MDQSNTTPQNLEPQPVTGTPASESTQVAESAVVTQPTPAPVVSTATAAVSSQTNEMPVKKKSGQGKFLVLGCVLVLCLTIFAFIGAGFVAYTSNQNIPVLSDLVETVERSVISDKQIGQLITSELAKQIDTLKDKDLTDLDYDLGYKSFEYDFSMDAVITSNGEDVSMKLKGNGVSNNNSATPVASMNLESELKATGLSLTPDLSVRTFGKDENLVMYLMLGDIPTSILPTAKQFNGKWVKFDLQDILEQAGYSDLNDLLQSTSSTPAKLKADDIEKLKKIIQDEELVNSFKRLPDQVFDGIRTTCVALSFTDARFKQYLKNLDQIMGSNTPVDFPADLKFNKFEITSCAGRQDKLPYKVSFSIDLSDKNTSMVMNGSMTNKNFNKDLKVDEPKPDMDYMDFIQNLYYGYPMGDPYNEYINGGLDLNTIL